MTNMDFDNLKYTIRSNENVTKKPWYDGTKYIDPQGNWFGWTDCGYHESVFFAGELWTRTFKASGKPTEPVKEELVTLRPAAPQPVPALRYCDIVGKPNDCEHCPFGDLLEMDDDCPVFKDKVEAAHEMVETAKKFLEAAEMLGV